MAGMTEREEGSFRGQSREAIKAMEEGLSKNGVSSGVCNEYTARRSFLIHGYLEGLPALPTLPANGDWFIFGYDGRYYQSIPLPFGWGRSPLWFTQLMIPFVRALRRLGYRVLAYLDDFLIIPSPTGTIASLQDCAKAISNVEHLMLSLGLKRLPQKGEWTGSTTAEHLGAQ